MTCPKKYTIFRIIDVFLISFIFITQSVVLSQYTVYARYHNTDFPSKNPSSAYQKILWLIGDFICLTAFVLACLCGFRHVRERRSILAGGRRRQFTNALVRYITSPNLPLCYISWLLYSVLLVLKVTLIFTSCLSDQWRSEHVNSHTIIFGPQILQMAIGLSAIVFSLLVEAQHNAGKDDPQRNAYLKSVSYEVALEILDTACMLSFLIMAFDEKESSSEACPSTLLTPPIITLSAINLVIPTLTLYKLTTTNFGESYHVKLELAYKTLHLLLVNIPFLVIRIHLWSDNDREDVILLVKNVYGVIGYFRGLYSDIQIINKEKEERAQNRRQVEDSQPRPGTVEMDKLM